MFKKYLFSIIWLSFLFFLYSKPAFALVTYQEDSTQTSGSYANGFMMKIGAGNDEPLNSASIVVKYESGAGITLQSPQLYSWTSSSYRDTTYTPQEFYYGNASRAWIYKPTKQSIVCTPSNRCQDVGTTSVKLLAGTDPVVISASNYIQGGSQPYLSSSRYWAIGFIATNSGQSVKIMGASAGSDAYYEAGATYTTLGSFPTYNAYVNHIPNVGAIAFSINGYTGVPIPTGSFTGQTINVNDGTVTYSGEGDFDLTGVGYKANISVFMQCSGSSPDVDFDLQGHVVASLNWYADDDVTTTIKIDDISYTGAGYTDSDSSYSFSGVTLPYESGMNCTYPVIVRIWDENGDIAYSTFDNCENEYAVYYNKNFFIPVSQYGFDENFNECLEEFDFVPVGSTSNQEYHVPTIPEEETGLQGMWNQFKAFFEESANNIIRLLFVDDRFMEIVPFLLSDINDSLSVRVPFGYLYDVYDMDLNVPSVYDTVPNMVISFGDSYGMSDITIDFPSGFDTVLNTVRTIWSIAIWFLLVLYIVSLGKRLF